MALRACSWLFTTHDTSKLALGSAAALSNILDFFRHSRNLLFRNDVRYGRIRVMEGFGYAKCISERRHTDAGADRR